MSLNKLIVAATISSLAANAYADFTAVDYNDNAVPWTKVLTLSGGVGWTDPGKTQTIYFTDGMTYNTYINHSKSRTYGFGELYFAVQSPAYYGSFWQMGIAVGGASESQLDGTIRYLNLVDIGTYNYHLTHSYVGLRGKLLGDPGMFLQPYITGLIGASFNQSYGFRTRPLVPTAISAPWYEKNTVVGFTYGIGAGVQKSINNNWQVGFGYEFSDWGKSELNYGLAPWTEVKGLHLKHVYANQILFSVSYLC